MVERSTGPTPVPSCRHAVGRIPDGRPGPHGVPQPPRPEPAPSGYPDWFWKGIGWVTRLTALTVVLGLYAVDPTTRSLW